MQMNCANVTREICGLCAGDVNGTHLPLNGYKMAEPSLELVNRGTLPITKEITFPVRAERDMELGAITLMLDYDPSLVLRFTLNENPLSELADGEGNVLQDARLSVADAGERVQGSGFKVEAASVVVYPNPVSSVLNIEYVMETDGEFSAEVRNLQGVILMKTGTSTTNAGWHMATIGLRNIPNGAYMLKVNCGDRLEMRKVIVNR
jgi:hypothetical protein